MSDVDENSVRSAACWRSVGCAAVTWTPRGTRPDRSSVARPGITTRGRLPRPQRVAPRKGELLGDGGAIRGLVAPGLPLTTNSSLPVSPVTAVAGRAAGCSSLGRTIWTRSLASTLSSKRALSTSVRLVEFDRGTAPGVAGFREQVGHSCGVRARNGPGSQGSLSKSVTFVEFERGAAPGSPSNLNGSHLIGGGGRATSSLSDRPRRVGQQPMKGGRGWEQRRCRAGRRRWWAGGMQSGGGS